MDTLSTEKRLLFAVKRVLSALGARLRRALGSVFQLVAHDQLGDLSRQTQRLSSASVESVTYLGSELRALDQRLSRMEDEIAALRALLEQSAEEKTTSGPSAG